MRISLNWLKDYISVGVPADKLADRLTMAGMEVEKISSLDGDTVLEMEITPNRPDCLNMLGIARETAAVFNKTCKFPQTKKLIFPKGKYPIEIWDKKGCPRYVGTLIGDVHVSKTPEWIKKRLNAVGIRSINNTVDITNFCLMETGQPLHAFDADKLMGGRIVVRRAYEGEMIVTIDEVKRQLDPSILVIADSKRAVAIAGIMGGKDTEVTSTTKNVLLESAYFDPVLIRRASRRLGVMSDSSYRFERGVDEARVEAAAQRAAALILDCTNGRLVKKTVVSFSRAPKARRAVIISSQRINSYLGADIPISRCKNILKRLGCRVISQRDVLKVTPPSFRMDIRQDIDIIEEICRIVGYDRLPLCLPHIKAQMITQDLKNNRAKKLKDIFLAQGFYEVISYSMISRKNLKSTKQESLEGIQIQNPLTQDQEIMRPSLLPGLLSAAVFNLNRGQRDLKCFEIGKIYAGRKEKDTLAVLMTGRICADWRQSVKQEAGYYDIKGALEQAWGRIGAQRVRFEPTEQPFLEKGQGVKVIYDGKDIGFAGKIDEAVLHHWDIQQSSVVFAEVSLEEVYSEPQEQKQYVPVTQFPAVVRDVSLAVKEEVTFGQIQEAIREAQAAILTSIKFLEEYRGEKIALGCRGLVFSLIYQSAERTLREEEVSKVHHEIVQRLVDKFEAVVR